jgi:hypothetical protein
MVPVLPHVVVQVGGDIEKADLRRGIGPIARYIATLVPNRP